MNDAIYQVEVLSTGYESLYRTPWQEAISDVFGGRAEVVDTHPTRKIKTVDGFIPMPLSIRFKVGVFAGAIKRPQKILRPNRKNIYSRDDGICSYCGKNLHYSDATIDHIFPRSRGGEDTWDNLTLSCGPCNLKKGNRTPSEAGMRIRSKRD